MAVKNEVASTSTTTGSKFGWAMLSVTRIAIGFVFLWAFLDKLLGLGFSTCRTTNDDGTFSIDAFCDKAWVNGGHVTEGYLVYGGNVNSPFHTFFVNLGDQRWTDWIFMLGLLGIGLALMLGIGTRVAAYSGFLMLLFMYMTQMWPSTNPILDEHIVYIVATFGIVWVELDRQSIGLGTWWRKLPIVQSNSWLV
ncbi:DoxX family protein [Demequina capsici]|uniref:DoxX family protein n=1 Tax=Demequina capsici TaxID=3075620 RepID=A0AA96F7V9_9MICO|nr:MULTISPECIES: DoxX family protein [unclassified Demequina]WNM25428.1 DoxX family protein [Demequina sp. OYTSA14]WNM28309.1 DoxX family protein [Demequina sp. PMTSA13]